MQYIIRRLLLKFRSGMHGLNEELDAEKENRNYVYTLCGAECESVVRVL